MYPNQIVLLKLIFLEEMTGEEEDILQYWIDGGRNGSEICISPNIRERRDYLREHGYSHFREIQLVGGRRGSKGLITGTAMAYMVERLVRMGNPHAHYGISPEKEIYFSCIAASESQAKEYQYADFVSTLETCKSLQAHLVKSLETECSVATTHDLRKMSALRSRGSKILRDISKIRGKALAANAGTIRGSATICTCMDEVAHMLPGESKASAESVYKALDPSLDQFGVDGMLFLNSSPWNKVGMFYRFYELNMRPFNPRASVEFTPLSDSEDEEGTPSNGDPRNFVFQFPSWALFENYRYYKSKYKPKTRGREFGKMITVSPDYDPEEVDAQGRPKFTDEDKVAILQARAKEAANPEAFKVERRGKFAEVTDSYLNPSMVDQMYKGVPDGYEEMPNGDYVKKYRLLPTNYGEAASNLFRYKFHLDPSSTTAGFGFAIGHIEYFPDSTGHDQEHVVLDMVKGWQPKDFPGNVIKWKVILDEVMTYAKIFMPFEITMDQHMSMEPLQELQDRLNAANVPCRVYMKPGTSELNWKRWEVFKTALYQGLIHAPYDEIPIPSPLGSGTYSSKEELKFLQVTNTRGKYPKVDKQDIGPVTTKDRADAICEVVYALIGNIHITNMRERLANTRLMVGGQGGYGMGIGHVDGKGPIPVGELYSQRDRTFGPAYSRFNLTRSATGFRTRGYPRSRGRLR